MPSPSIAMLTLSIVSHGHGPLLHNLLTDLQSCSGLEGARVVVTLNLANESFDRSAYPGLDIVVLRNPVPKGFGANHNAAFEHCRTPWFLILNPDLRITDPKCFESLATSAERHPQVGILAPVITNSSGTPEDSVRFNLSLPALLGRAMGKRHVQPDTSVPSRKPGPFYWLAGMFLMVRSDRFSQVGRFDERFFLYCEDYDLSARMYNEGHSILQVPDVRAIHDAQRDSHRSLKHLRLHVVSLLKVWTSRAFWRVTLGT